MTVEDLYTYFKASYMCSHLSCGDCTGLLNKPDKDGCPFDRIDKEHIRKKLFDLADKLIEKENKDYPIDENSLVDLLMHELIGK